MKGLKGTKIFEMLGRKRIIRLLVILIIILSITSASFVAMAIKKDNIDKQEESIAYTESSIVNYKVYLKENDFFDQEYLEQNRQYIASIISHINANLKYELNSSKYNDNFNYKYSIVAETNVEDISNKNIIYKFSEFLLEEKALQFYNTSKIEINEEVNIDYNKYNEIIKRFLDVYGLDGINPTLTINMYVSVNGLTKSAGTPVASLTIPLTTKTVAIDIESNEVNATEITTVYKKIANKNQLYMAILTFALAAMVGIELYIFVNDTKDEVTVYKMKIKKILLNYDSYIQKIENVFDYEGHQVIEMKTFEDLLQVRDTISEPILMIEKAKETDFIIPSKGNVVYIFKLKVKSLNKDKKEKSTDKQELKV